MCLCPVWFFESTVAVFVVLVVLPFFGVGGSGVVGFFLQPRPRVRETVRIMTDSLGYKTRMGGSMLQSKVSASREPIELAMRYL